MEVILTVVNTVTISFGVYLFALFFTATWLTRRSRKTETEFLTGQRLTTNND